MLGKHLQVRYQKLSSYFPEIWFWILCSMVVLHTALLLITGLHSLYTPPIQMLRPLVTCGAVILLLQPSYMQHSTQRWSKICLAIGMICSALFSALKISLGASMQQSAQPTPLKIRTSVAYSRDAPIGGPKRVRFFVGPAAENAAAFQTRWRVPGRL